MSLIYHWFVSVEKSNSLTGVLIFILG